MTLPDHADGRYLLGIVRNLAEQRELVALSTTIVEERMRWRDRELQSLGADLDELKRLHAEHRPLIGAIATRALSAERTVDEIFFLDELKKAFMSLRPSHLQAELEHLTRVLAASFRVPLDRRQRIILALASAAWPIGQVDTSV